MSLQQISDEDFAAAVAEASSYSDLLKRLRLPKCNNWHPVKERAAAYDCSHFHSLHHISDEEFKAAVTSSNTVADLCRRLGRPESKWNSVKRRAQQYDCSHFKKRCTPSDDDFRSAVQQSWSIESLRVRLGYVLSGTCYARLKKRMARLGLNQHDFGPTPPRARTGSRPLSRDEVFRLREKTPRRKKQSGATLCAALLRTGREYRCAECGLGPKWNGKSLKLQVDHKSGDPYDDRIENLRFLCPNCHTQTPTFCGRNIKVRPEPALKLIQGGAA